ncbi:Ig-like domain-containing protein [Kordiimonas marina]|uniref:Ig-like domain-containing protein n=1 Tax=Kordiimonas marina TaxID=2872312 RepID=UPI001FF4F8AD|nr:Ig-like domain-containing protein [Kordiimonas marina]MCJ9427999.1 cadherin-like domain-containing protein [Kordiimonas marina]
MRSLTFVLDTQTGNDGMAPATVTISEQADGSLLFTISNENDGDNAIGDIRGLFFDVADDSLIGNLTVLGTDITDFDDSGSVSNLGGGVTTSGVPDSPFEVGIEFGTPGISTDDYQTTSFTLSSDLRGLTLDDVALESMAVRQTSVTDANGGRDDSDKLYGDAPYPVNAIDDEAFTFEDATVGGNVFANDIDKDAGDADGNGIPDGLTVTAVDGDAGSVGGAIELADGIFVTVNEDGSYVLDATDADWLGVGEHFTADVTYDVNDGNGGTDSATLSVDVEGLNDTPTANPDEATTDEATTVSGSVLGNDTDPDLNDVLSVSAVNGDEAAVGSQVTLSSGALLTLNADGTFDYDPNGQFDGLNDGETATDSFTYQVTDGNGGFDTTTVTMTIEGIGSSGPVDPEGPGDDQFGVFLNKHGNEQDISNIVLYMKDDAGDFIKIKIDGWNGVTDLDDVDLGNFLDDHAEFDDYELYAVSIKAGNNHNKDLGPGEGQLFLLDGDEDIDYVAGGDAPEGMTSGLLSAKVDYSFDYSADMFI